MPQKLREAPEMRLPEPAYANLETVNDYIRQHIDREVQAEILAGVVTPENIRKWRLSALLSQKQLARLAGYSRYTISFFETGHIPITKRFIKRLQEAAGRLDEGLLRTAPGYNFPEDVTSAKRYIPIHLITRGGRWAPCMRCGKPYFQTNRRQIYCTVNC